MPPQSQKWKSTLFTLSSILLLSPTFSTSTSTPSSSGTVTTRKSKGELEPEAHPGNGGGGPGLENGGYGVNVNVNNLGAFPTTSTSTLSLNVAPQGAGGGHPIPNYNSWESQIYQTSGPSASGLAPGAKPGQRSPYTFINPNKFRSKGDDGINDTRGTVRYNILPNGYIAPGIVTNPADDNAPYTQAYVPDEHVNSYTPHSEEEDQEQELDD